MFRDIARRMKSGKNNQDSSAEKNGDGLYKIYIPLPIGFDPQKLKVRHAVNGYFVEYEMQQTTKNGGYVYSKLQQLYFSGTFPYRLEKTEASINKNKLTIKYIKGESLMNGYSDVVIKEKEKRKKNKGKSSSEEESYDIEVL